MTFSEPFRKSHVFLTIAIIYTFIVMLKVLAKVQLTQAEWLLFISEPGSMEDIFQRLFIPLDCEFLVAQWQTDGTVILTEVYHISTRSALERHNVGNWSPRRGLQWRTTGFYKRRKNLRGLDLRVVVSEVRPFVHFFLSSVLTKNMELELELERSESVA
jgi:hypothetical protein